MVLMNGQCLDCLLYTSSPLFYFSYSMAKAIDSFVWMYFSTVSHEAVLPFNTLCSADSSRIGSPTFCFIKTSALVHSKRRWNLASHQQHAGITGMVEMHQGSIWQLIIKAPRKRLQRREIVSLCECKTKINSEPLEYFRFLKICLFEVD